MNSKTLLNHFFTIIFILLLISCSAQSTGDYRSNALLMNWDTPGDWQTWDAATSSWITAGTIPDAQHALITIQQGHTVMITTPHTADRLVVKGTLKNTSTTFTINDGPGDDVMIHAGGKILNEGSNAFVINFGKLIMNDSIINKSTCTFTNKGTLVNDHAYFRNAGKLINEATSIIINSGDFLTGGSISFEKGSLYQHNFPSTQATAGTIPTASWKNGSVCEILACGNAFQPGALNQVFHHFIWNNSTQPHDFNLIANPNVVNGNFEIKNTNEKKLAYKGSSSGELAIADSFKITGGIFVLTNGSASTVVNASTYYQRAGILDMSSSSATSTMQISASFTHRGGTLQHSGAAASNTIVLNGSSSSTIESPGFRTGDPITFKISKQGATGTCTIPFDKLFMLNQGTSLKLIDNTNLANDFQIDGTLHVKTNTWELTQGLSIVNGNFINQSLSDISMNSGSATLQFKAGSFYMHAGDGGEVVTATWSDASTVKVTGIQLATVLKNGGQQFGTVFWDCKNQQQPCIFGSAGFEISGNFTIESTGKGILRFPDCDFRVKGDLTLRNDAQLQLAAAEGLYNPVQRNIVIDGTVSILQTASMQVGNPNASATPTSNADQYRIYNLQIKKDFIHTSTTPLISYHHKSYPGNANDDAYFLSLTFNGNAVQHLIMKKQLTDLITLSPTEYMSSNVYQLLVSGTGTHLIPQLNDLKVYDLLVAANDTLTTAMEDINIVQYSTRSFTGASAAPSCTINGVADLGLNTLSDENSNGSFYLQAGATLLTKHPQGIDESGLTGSIQNTGVRFFDPAAHYVYNGTGNQVSGTGLPVILSGSLTIDNSMLPAFGGTTLTRNTIINGTLVLKKGKLFTAPTAVLTIGSRGTIIPEGGQALSFVDGPVRKTNLSSGTEFIFPTGNKNKWARIGIIPESPSTGEFMATYINANPTTISNTLVNLDHISTKEYWKLDQTNQSEKVKIKLFWESGNYSGIYSSAPADLKIAHNDLLPNTANKWKPEEGNVLIIGNPTIGNIQATADLSGVNLFTFGSTTSINPLPVELLSFTGNTTPKGNLLNWITASEQNNQFFCIQRSSNGKSFSPVGIVNGRGNSSNLQYYSFTDSMLSNTQLYYRLKQTDTDGNHTYSAIIQIEPLNHDIQEMVIYPNPAIANDIHIITSASIQSFRIYNLLGKAVFEEHSTIENNEHVFTPDSSGIYFIKAITVDGRTITRRLIKS
jgi:hypothetical protein